MQAASPLQGVSMPCASTLPAQVGHVEGKGQEGAAVRISIAPNPSHLEYVGPVVLGMVRAEQTRLQDHTRQRVMGLLIHGDAAFAGLGVVAETLQLADVPGKHTACSQLCGV